MSVARKIASKQGPGRKSFNRYAEELVLLSAHFFASAQNVDKPGANQELQQIHEALAHRLEQVGALLKLRAKKLKAVR